MPKNAEVKSTSAEHAAPDADILKRVEILTEQMAKQQQQISEMGANVQVVLEQNKALLEQIAQKSFQSSVKVERPQVKMEMPHSSTMLKTGMSTGRRAGKTPHPPPKSPPPPIPTE